jgi:hypothetical protein
MSKQYVRGAVTYRTCRHCQGLACVHCNGKGQVRAAVYRRLDPAAGAVLSWLRGNAVGPQAVGR